MKFIVDQQLPPALADWLITKGHQAEHVFLVGLGAANDREIWRYATQSGAIIVTKDMDFAERRERETGGPKVVWLRVGNTTTPELLARLERSWRAIESALAVESVVELR